MPVSQDWRQQAARDRHERLENRRRDAIRRLRRIEAVARARLAFEGPTFDPRQVVLDSERYAAPLAERLGPRERVQILLWGSLIGVGLVALVSFFSAPLMDVDTAISAVLIAAMLAMSYVL